MNAGFVRFDRGELVFYPKLPDTSRVKTIGGRWKNSTWRLPGLHCYLSQLKSMYPEISLHEDLGVLDSDLGFAVRSPSIPLNLRSSWEKMYVFQKEGAAFLMSTPHPGAMLALSPGLGKTLTSLVSGFGLGVQSILVVAPLSLLDTWHREARAWVDHSFDICWGKSPTGNFVITNYDTVSRRLAEYKRPWDLIIVDESVLLKNRDTKRARAFRELRGSAGKIWMLSGSPITRDVTDLWSQFNILLPRAFTSFWRFAENYCDFEDDQWSPTHRQILGSKQNIDFKSEFRDIMFVRSQEDVLDLPQRRFQTIDLHLLPEQRRVYLELLDNFTTKLESGATLSVPTILSQLIRLQQIASCLSNVDGSDASIKHQTILEMLRDKLWEFPVLIWTHWVPGARALLQKLEKVGIRAAIATGSDTTRSSVEDTIAAFKSGEYDVLILSLGVGKYGHTVTNVRTEVYVEKSWDADSYVQSLSRVRRIGLDHSPLLVSLRCLGTVDELVEDNLMTKSVDISRVGPPDLVQLLRGLGRTL